MLSEDRMQSCLKIMSVKGMNMKGMGMMGDGEMKIYERKPESNEGVNNIKSKINIKAYALEIRIKNLDYNIIEKLAGKDLLSYQSFTEEDGCYFTMTYKNNK